LPHCDSQRYKITIETQMNFLRVVIIAWCAYTSKAVVCDTNEILVTATGEPFETSICGTACDPYNINFLRLELAHIDKCPSETTEIVIAYADTATDYFDGGLDAVYLRPPGANLPGFNRVMLASIIEKYSETCPEPQILGTNRYSTSVLNASHTVPLYHFAGKTEQYTLTMTEMEKYPGDYTIILRDNNTTATHLLNTGPYTFLGDPTDNVGGWLGLYGSKRFELIIVPTIDGYASCQFNCGAAESKNKCEKDAYKAAGCKWLTTDDWPDLTIPDGECINLSFIPVDCSDAVKVNGKPSYITCRKTFPYSAKCLWVRTATQPNGACLALDEEYTPLTCDLAVRGETEKPSKYKCLSKPFKKINCEWKCPPDQPEKECVENVLYI